MGLVLHGCCPCAGIAQHGHNHGLGTHGHSHKQPGERTNINIRAAFIHVLGDLLQSIGVLISAYIIKYNVRCRSLLLFFLLKLKLWASWSCMTETKDDRKDICRNEKHRALILS